MRVALLALVLLAGCLDGTDTRSTAAVDEGVPWQANLECAITHADGAPARCPAPDDARPETPSVAAQLGIGFRCVLWPPWAEDQPHLPRWWLFVGPAPIREGRLPDGPHALALVYEWPGFEGTVMGVLTRHAPPGPTYIFEGPARGVVLLPEGFSAAEVMITGVLSQEPPTRHDHLGVHWDVQATGERPMEIRYRAVDMVQIHGDIAYAAADAWFDGILQEIHFDDHRDMPGLAHWGQAWDFNLTSSIPVAEEDITRPILPFYGEVEDIDSPVMDMLCRCPAWVAGVLCIADLPPATPTLGRQAL